MRAFILALAALLLSACGFQPLYATNRDATVDVALADVSVGTLTGAPSAAAPFLDAMRDALPGEGGTLSRYQLNVELREQRAAVAVTASANTQRYDYVLTADYQLVDRISGDRVHNQRLDSVVSYGVVSSQYASYVAQEDAVRRASGDLAKKIEFDVALFFKGRAPRTGAIERVDPNVGATTIMDRQVEDDFLEEEEIDEDATGTSSGDDGADSDPE